MEQDFYFKEMSIFPDLFYLDIDIDRKEAIGQMGKIGLVKGYLYGLQKVDLYDPDETLYEVYGRQIYKPDEKMAEVVKRFDPLIDVNAPVPTVKLSDAIAMFEKQEKDDIALMKQAGHVEAYSFLPEARKTEAVTDTIISVCPEAILKAPEWQQTNERYLTAIKLKGNLIESINDDRLTEEMYRTAVRANPHLLGDIPDRLKTEEFCKEVVALNGFVLKHVPEALRTKEICYTAFESSREYFEKNSTNCSRFFKEIAYPEICLEALQQYGSKIGAFDLIKEIRPEAINTDVATEAVKQDIRCITRIPRHIEIKDMPEVTPVERANIERIADDGPAKNEFETLSTDEKTEMVSLAAVKTWSYNLHAVPEETCSDKVIMAALEKDGELLGIVPLERRTKQMYETALEHCLGHGIEVLDLFPAELRNPEMYMKAVRIDCECLMAIPDQDKTREMCRIASEDWITSSFGEAGILSFVPFADVCLDMLKRFSDSSDIMEMLQHVDPKIINEEIRNFAISRNGCCLGLIPESLQDEETALKAVKHSGLLALRYTSVKDGICTEKVYETGIKMGEQSALCAKKEKLTPQLCRLIKNLYPDFFIHHPDRLPDSLGSLSGLEKFAAVWETGELLGVLPPNRIDPKIAAWFVQEDPSLFSWLPKNVQTEELAFAAAQRSGSMAFLGNFDKTVMTDRVIQEARMTDLALTLRTSERPTAESCLEIEKRFPRFWEQHADLLPQKVREGSNVYRLNKMIEKMTSEKFSVSQIKELFGGGVLPVGKVTLGDKVIYDQIVTFDTKSQNLKVSPMTEQTTNRKNKQKQDVEKQKKTEIHPKRRGPKI